MITTILWKPGICSIAYSFGQSLCPALCYVSIFVLCGSCFQKLHSQAAEDEGHVNEYIRMGSRTIKGLVETQGREQELCCWGVSKDFKEVTFELGLER